MHIIRNDTPHLPLLFRAFNSHFYTTIVLPNDHNEKIENEIKTAKQSQYNNLLTNCINHPNIFSRLNKKCLFYVFLEKKTSYCFIQQWVAITSSIFWLFSLLFWKRKENIVFHLIRTCIFLLCTACEPSKHIPLKVTIVNETIFKQKKYQNRSIKLNRNRLAKRKKIAAT